MRPYPTAAALFGKRLELTLSLGFCLLFGFHGPDWGNALWSDGAAAPESRGSAAGDNLAPDHD
jgi:hypothetical protein